MMSPDELEKNDENKGYWKVRTKFNIEVEGKEYTNLKFTSDEVDVKLLDRVVVLQSKFYKDNLLFIPFENILSIEFIPAKVKQVVH